MLYPTIGIPFMGTGIFRRYDQYQYTRCLQRAGATVQTLALHAFSGAVDAALEKCDGFLFPGGPDIQPERYGQDRLPSCREPEPARDDFEFLLLGAALAAQKPLLCIGRGMQLLNVAFGGTLMQDIRLKQEYQHSDFWHRTSATHPIDLDPDSLLSDLLDTDTLSVNSLHHQAVDEVGEGLWIPADSPEGFAEALELEDYPFCLAVQWRPEYMAGRTPVQQRLFQALTDACR
ncbi:MAG: gamma-glutamyl-gamma-aminobutyrate hydrolase family protein [Lachnospiraceae bacterium]|nr:gamma-glutamyl-gamma-aminobutyrate hydrolase family protein [Lachnospiraceae bacterium]MCI9601151.1 gamma-glutamyl-gamma-aminobutyrate hydrolase family protein [Lachnospiraceae bacterium]